MKVITIAYKSTNCYLVPCNDGWLMIDAGWPDTFSNVLQLLNSNDIPVNKINYLVVTHFHPDHAGLTQRLRDLGTDLILHESQIPYVGKLNNFFKKNRNANFKDIIASNSIEVSDGTSRDFLQSIGIDGELISTPGHSEDSISLIIDGDCAFTGDLPSLSLAAAYRDEVVDHSWESIKQYQVKTIYPGHGDPYEFEY